MKKYKVHIIELDYHHDVLDTLIQLIDISSFHITCTTTKAIYNKLSKESKSKIHLFNSWNGSSHSLGQLIITESDVKIINTIASNFSFWKNHIDSKTIIRIHNINTWFQPWNSLTLDFNLYDIRKALTYIIQHQILKREYKHLKVIREKAQHFSFLSDATSNYFNTAFPEHSRKNCFTIPTSWSLQGDIEITSKPEFQITIPGTIERKRKDFKLIERLIDYLNTLDGNFRLTFAGQVTKQSENFMLDLLSRAKKHIEIIYFKSFVSAEQFDAILHSTDLLFFPLVSKTRFKIFAEYYGKTKISGSENDFIKYGIPALMNDFYFIESPLIYAYNGNNFKNQLQLAIMDIKKDAPQVITYMKEHQLKFSFEIQRNRLSEQLRSFIEAT